MRRSGPELLYRVICPGLARKHVDYDVDEVGDYPAALGIARHAVALDARLAHRLLRVRDKRLQVGRGGTCGDDEEIRERTLAADIVDFDVLGLLFLKGLRDDLCFLCCFHGAHYTINDCLIVRLFEATERRSEACARPARPTRSLRAPHRHDFDVYRGGRNHVGPANVLL